MAAAANVISRDEGQKEQAPSAATTSRRPPCLSGPGRRACFDPPLPRRLDSSAAGSKDDEGVIGGCLLYCNQTLPWPITRRTRAIRASSGPHTCPVATRAHLHWEDTSSRSRTPQKISKVARIGCWIIRHIESFNSYIKY